MEISNEPFVATVPLPQAQESVPVPAKKSNKLLITLLIALPILVVLCCLICSILTFLIVSTDNKVDEDVKSVTSSACRSLSASGNLQFYLAGDVQTQASKFNSQMEGCIGFSSIQTTDLDIVNGNDVVTIHGKMNYENSTLRDVVMKFFKEGNARKIAYFTFE